ncbi:uncharacterized protein ASCRUDRAFT_132596 [Ascoidea rubescens DSM 1968]|uniref:Uncharacterized protein n=1 Tax=Ascoidea rubescens DSM 1968 TaxID=1344418 RepID=A0A1D2VKR1_9ASCO|nr:hypothetical protein ASCRUDRAFT_132596 [Ascoidea rubescens DSM 1968]ODV62168.1 hypothetical protein ASCRUDRAFT_132596 [Ascoidea rubescens DSM 1968]
MDPLNPSLLSPLKQLQLPPKIERAKVPIYKSKTLDTLPSYQKTLNSFETNNNNNDDLSINTNTNNPSNHSLSDVFRSNTSYNSHIKKLSSSTQPESNTISKEELPERPKLIRRSSMKTPGRSRRNSSVDSSRRVSFNPTVDINKFDNKQPPILNKLETEKIKRSESAQNLRISNYLNGIFPDSVSNSLNDSNDNNDFEVQIINKSDKGDPFSIQNNRNAVLFNGTDPNQIRDTDNSHQNMFKIDNSLNSNGNRRKNDNSITHKKLRKKKNSGSRHKRESSKNLVYSTEKLKKKALRLNKPNTGDNPELIKILMILSYVCFSNDYTNENFLQNYPKYYHSITFDNRYERARHVRNISSFYSFILIVLVILIISVPSFIFLELFV